MMNHIIFFKQAIYLIKKFSGRKSSLVTPILIGAFLAISPPVFAKADLIIESISGFQSAYSVGAPMPIFKVRVMNIGDLAVPKLKAIAVTLERCKYIWKGYESNCKPDIAGGNSSTSHDINGLAPGASVDIPLPVLWPGMPTKLFKEGDYILNFKVAGFGEATYTNNEYNLNIPVTYPGVDSFVLTMKGIDYIGPCPINDLHVAEGKIFVVHGSGYIDYQIVSSFNNPNNPPHTYSKAVDNKESIPAGMKTATDHDVDGWAAIKVLSPYEEMSEKGYFKIRCTNTDFKKKLKINPANKLKVVPKYKIIPK